MNDTEKNDEASTPPPERRGKFLLSDIALIVEGATVLSIVSSPIWIWLTFVPVVQIVSILLIIATICAPIVGVILGVLSLCYHPRGKHNIACSVVAIAVPVIAILTVIILFSTRVIVISLM